MKNEIDKIINLIQVGNNIEAIRLAKSLFLKFPKNINAIKILAYSYIQIGNFEKVIEILTEGYETQNETKRENYYYFSINNSNVTPCVPIIQKLETNKETLTCRVNVN